MHDKVPDEPVKQPEATSTVHAPEINRVFGKQLFREMVKLQIEDEPLRWTQRRELVKFGRRLGIDTFEARLIIRAVEYECGLAAPALLDDRESPANTQLVAKADESFSSIAPLLFVPVTALILLLLAWLFFSRL